MNRGSAAVRRREAPQPNPYLGLSAAELAHAAADLADELRELRWRTPNERYDLANRCIHMLGACAFVIHHEHVVAERLAQ